MPDNDCGDLELPARDDLVIDLLYFWKLDSYNPGGGNVPAWPFEGNAPISPNCVEVGNGPGNSPGKWCGILKPGLAADVKYDVKVLTGANPPPILDPVIIARP